MADARTHLYANNASCRLGAGLGAGETVLELEAGKGALFPSPGGGQIFILTVEDLAQSKREIMYCTSRTGDELTVERGKEGTDAVDWVVNTTTFVQQRVTAGTLEHLEESGGGGGGAVVAVVTVTSDGDISEDFPTPLNVSDVLLAGVGDYQVTLTSAPSTIYGIAVSVLDGTGAGFNAGGGGGVINVTTRDLSGDNSNKGFTLIVYGA